MKRFYGLTALVASLIILANGFTQQPITYSTSSPNSPATVGNSLERKSIDERRAETSIVVENRKSPSILHKDEQKMINRKSSKTTFITRETKFTTPLTTQVPTTQLLLINVYSVTNVQSENLTAIQNSSEIFPKLSKTKLTITLDEHQSQKEINDSNSREISNLIITSRANYTNDNLTNSKTNFLQLLPKNNKPTNKISHNFNQTQLLEIISQKTNSQLQNNTKQIKNFQIQNVNISHSSNYRTFQESNTNSFLTDDYSINSQRAQFTAKLNQSLFTIKNFSQSKFPTRKVSSNSHQTTVNSVLNKQIKSDKTFSQIVNRNSEIQVNKDSTTREVSNLFHEASEFQSEIGSPTRKVNLFQKVKDNFKSEIRALESKNSLLKTLLPLDQNSTNNQKSFHDNNNNNNNNESELKKTNSPETLRKHKRKNSEFQRKMRITLFKLTKRRVKNVIPEQKKNRNNKSKMEILNESLTVELEPTIMNKMKENTNDNEEEKDDTLNDISRIMNKGPKGKLNYSHGKTKRGQVVKSLLTSTNNANSHSFENQNQNQIISKNSKNPFTQTSPLNNKSQNSPTDFHFSRLSSNSSEYSNSEKSREINSNSNFIASEIRDPLNKTTVPSTIPNSLPSLKITTTPFFNSPEKLSKNEYFLEKNSTSKENYNNDNNESLNLSKSFDKIAALNSSLILLKMNPNENYFNLSLIREADEDENGENFTKIATPVNLWPVKHSAVVEGDLVLGGLMMVHEREDTITCGPVMPQGGVQALEAMLYTLDRLNQEEIVPGVKIGAHILDDCDKDTYGLEMAVDFIKGKLGRKKNCFQFSSLFFYHILYY